MLKFASYDRIKVRDNSTRLRICQCKEWMQKGDQRDEHRKMVTRKTPMKVGKNRGWRWFPQSTINDRRYRWMMIVFCLDFSLSIKCPVVSSNDIDFSFVCPLPYLSSFGFFSINALFKFLDNYNGNGSLIIGFSYPISNDKIFFPSLCNLFPLTASLAELAPHWTPSFLGQSVIGFSWLDLSVAS